MDQASRCPARDSTTSHVLATFHEKIAHDLNYVAERRLLTTGMKLQAALGLTERLDAVEQLEDALDELDEALHEVRTAIADLRDGIAFL